MWANRHQCSDGQEAQQEIRQEAVHALRKKIEGLDKEMAIKREEIKESCAWLAADAKRRFILIQFIETFWREEGCLFPTPYVPSSNAKRPDT